MKILDTNLTFAVRCANCGRIKFHNISMFELLAGSSQELNCDCGSVELTAAFKDNKTIVVDIPCVACDTVHTYRYNMKDILRRKVTVICCIETGFELCFLGVAGDVKDMVYKYQKDLDQLMGELGLAHDVERLF
jgi:hypothetical protein